MGWASALLGRLTMWSSNKQSSSSSSQPPPVFAVDRTEVAVAADTGVPELTIRELNKATRSFSAAMLIGRGQNNAMVVYRATLPVGNNGKAAAVAKRIVRPRRWSGSPGPDGEDDEFLRQQVLVLSRLRHDNVVRLLGYTIESRADVRALLFEFADMGTLHDVLHGPPTATGKPARSRPVLSWSQRTGIALDVARGLEYLHEAAAMAHCGVCSSKVLLFQGFRAKIADYDMAMRLPEVANAHLPNDGRCYPPEYLAVGQKTSKFDVYSYGVLLLELLTGMTFPYLKRRLLGAPILNEGRVERFMDPKLGTLYPPDRARKLATIALTCLQEKTQSRPSMGDVAQTISCHIIVSSETGSPSRLG